MSAIRYGKIFTGFFVAAAVFTACGGVDKGRINIVDEDGGSDGSGGTVNPGGGSSGNGGTNSTNGGDGQGEAGEGTVPVLPEPPVVVSISPDVGESEVEPSGTVVIEFSEGLDPSTVLSGDSVIVYDGETPVPGSLHYRGVTVTFTPEERLDLLGEYSVVVTTSITDTGGTPMAEDFSSSFTVRDGVWSESLVVENPTGLLNRTLVSPVIDGAGNVLVVWGQAKDGETVSSVFGRYFIPGGAFGAPFEIDEAAVDCDDISVAMNADGEAIVAWTENHANTEQVWVRRLNQGTPFGAPERIDAAAVTQVVGTVSAVSATGKAHVLWSYTSATTKENILASYAGADEAWLPTPDIIMNNSDQLSPPALAFDNDGNGFVFFAYDTDNTAAQAPKLSARRYLEASGQWGNNTLIDGSDGASLFDPPSAAADEEGGARVVFAVGQDVLAAGFSKAGGFSAAAAIDALNASPESVPKVSSNGAQYLAAWYQSASTTKNAYSALSDGGAFAPSELRSNGDLEVSYYGNAVSGLDSQGNGFVLFEQVNGAGGVDIAFGRLVGINGEWSDGSLVNSVEGNYQDPRIAVAPNGIAVAAWSVGIRLTATSIYVSTFE